MEIKIEYDVETDAVYIYLTEEPLEPGRTTIEIDSNVALDFKDNKLVGIEVLQASEVLHKDLLDMDNETHAAYTKKLAVRDSLIQELFDFAKAQGADYGLWIEEWEEAGRTDLIELSEELGLI